MNTKNIMKGAVAFAAVFALASCTSENEPATEIVSKSVPLEVSVSGIEASTRSIIESKNLPNGSEFSLFAYAAGQETFINGGINDKVVMNGSVAQISNQILIPTDNNVEVRAIYPYQQDLKDDKYVDIKAFAGVTDYLWGTGDGYATILQPKVPIYFRHVLARITLRITTTDDNESSYDFVGAKLKSGKYAENCFDYAILDIYSGKFVEKQWLNEGSPAQLSQKTLSRNTKPLLMDFLVIPSDKTDYYVNIDSNSTLLVDGVQLPLNNYQANVQYIYNVQISDGKKLVITDCQIIPWENNEMEGDINIVE